MASFAQQRAGRVGGASPDRGRGSPKSSLHVDFAAPGEMKERKEKYLTAKYGAHQMALIRKRLGVEMWMFDQLQALYPQKTDGKSEEKEVDLDELLDLEDETKRRKFLREHLSDCTYPQEQVHKFIDELLERAKIL